MVNWLSELHKVKPVVIDPTDPQYERWRVKRRWAKHAVARVYTLCGSKMIDFNLKHTDLELPDRCPVFDTELSYTGTRAKEANAPTLDRVVPAKGYVKGNVRIISWRANRIKSDASLEELEAIVAYVHCSSK